MKLILFPLLIGSFCLCSLALLRAGELSSLKLTKAPNARAEESFGAAIDISGDTLAVGAPGRDGHGSVMIYQKDGSDWLFVQEFTANNVAAGDRFGASLDLEGDRLIVGAPDRSSNDLHLSGAAYIFTRSEGSWTQSSYLRASNAGELDGFGAAVAIDGDRAAVGAPFEQSLSANPLDNSSFSGAGAVYVFVEEDSVWSQNAYLKADYPSELDDFGAAVDLSGDLLAVGSPGESSNAQGIDGNQQNDLAFSSGAVFLFKFDENWQLNAYLKSSRSMTGDMFGQSIDLEGDRIAVSARGDDEAGSNAGAVHVFEKFAADWAETATVVAANADSGDNFGQSIDLDGELLLISSTSERSAAVGINADSSDNSISQAGAAYLFELSETQWTFSQYIKASNTGGGDRFGTSVALDNGQLAISADGEDSNSALDQPNAEVESGAVYSSDFSFGGFAEWIEQQMLVGDDALPGADPLGSGQSNLIRYALDLAPWEIAQFEYDVSGNLSVFIPSPPRPDIRYQWRSSENLSQWEPIATLYPNGILAGNIALFTSVPKGIDKTQITLENPLNWMEPGSQIFVQLRIELVTE